ncbi:DUF2797 domain-containing protein [Streptomyces sp. NBC_01498]|uniref:DUF2797 domain-containing protein n=1 Tax=Streptomyces sp. NBC_01498 TaxID=2975870 RepID=UPI002E7B8115|nr:DUF2797 domain-containing protein [Streptomyces sp. NBC_01498]WTL25975.1 DUF2797 domain-containing protein [Streptomyces sp. NBC_01498]
MPRGWRCAGLRWSPDGAALVWRDGARERISALAYGRELAFRAIGARHCAGVRGLDCPLGPLGASVSGRSTGGQCPDCARLDRSRSVAADTVADDPRPYTVYLAWFGPGMVKVGITAEARGSARLLEQGAVVFTLLGRGPLMAARRTEELLRTALDVPDRVPYAAKRAVRATLPADPVERAAEVRELYGRAVALSGWPESLERAALEPVDHVHVFGLAGAPPATGVIGELVDGGRVAGRLVAAAGPDLHLDRGDGAVLVLDTRLVRGWELAAAGDGEVTVPVRDLAGTDPAVQDGLF